MGLFRVEKDTMSQLQTIGKHATTVVRSEQETHVTYHNTKVVSFDHENIILNTGGWKTPTTKIRMNQTSNEYDLGYRVFQHEYEWFVDYKTITRPFEGDKLVLQR